MISMKILYFDILSLLYSNQYIDSDPNVPIPFDKWFRTRTKTLLETVTPDFRSINNQRNTASEAGLLISPLGACYSRAYLIKNGVFSDYELAPETDLSFRMRMDDSDPTRQMIAHAYRLNAQWFVCGDIASEELLPPVF